MSDDAFLNNDSLEERLVAYLDGELDPEGRRQVEALLASDSRARIMLNSLERTWQMLEELDSPSPGEKFTQSTLEMVAIAAKEEVEQELAEAPRRQRRRRWVFVAGILASMVAGFFAVLLLLPDPNRQLYEDLPILEHLDEYRQIGDVQYLRALREKGLFSKETPDDASEKDDSNLTPQQRIDGMGIAEKEQLQRAQQRFASFEPEEQASLRRLHDELQADKDRDALRLVLQRYWQWLKVLPAYNRAELANMDLPDRVEWVKKRLDLERVREKEKRIGKKDAEVVLNWVKKHALQQETSLLQGIPEAQRKKLREMNQNMRQNLILWQLSQWWQATESGKAPPMMTDKDLEELCDKLGPESRKVLESKPTEERWELVILWTRQAIRQHLGNKTLRIPAADDALAEFFERGLKDEDRERLLNMSGEDMQRELIRLFFQDSNAAEKAEKNEHELKANKKP